MESSVPRPGGLPSSRRGVGALTVPLYLDDLRLIEDLSSRNGVRRCDAVASRLLRVQYLLVAVGAARRRRPFVGVSRCPAGAAGALPVTSTADGVDTLRATIPEEFVAALAPIVGVPITSVHRRSVGDRPTRRGCRVRAVRVCGARRDAGERLRRRARTRRPAQAVGPRDRRLSGPAGAAAAITLAEAGRRARSSNAGRIATSSRRRSSASACRLPRDRCRSDSARGGVLRGGSSSRAPASRPPGARTATARHSPIHTDLDGISIRRSSIATFAGAPSR